MLGREAREEWEEVPGKRYGWRAGSRGLDIKYRAQWNVGGAV